VDLAFKECNRLQAENAALKAQVALYRKQHDEKLECNVRVYGINVGDNLPREEEIDDGRCDICMRADELLITPI
jgi:hypothetical protein